MSVAPKNYVILKSLQGFGRVSAYLALQQLISREVILYQVTLFHSDPPQALGVCEQELKKWARLAHRNLSAVFDGWVEDRKLCFVARKPEGNTLYDVLKRGVGLRIEQAREIAVTTARVLHYLHQNNVYQRSPMIASHFVLEEDQWIRMSEKALVLRLNERLENAQLELRQSEEESRAAMLQDISAWGALCGALVTNDTEFGLRHVIGRKMPEFTLDEANLRRQHSDVPEGFERLILRALATSLAPQQGYGGFAEILSELAKSAAP